MARKTAKQWARLVARWKRSGLSAGEFGVKVGVDARRLHWWSWALRKRDGIRDSTPAPTEVIPTFLPVHLVEPPVPLESAPPPAQNPVEIVVDERLSIRVASGFDEETLRRVIDLVASTTGRR